MTQFADITVKNGNSTPSDVLFTGITPQSGSDPALWYYKAGIPRTSYVRLTTNVRRSGSNAATKAVMNLNMPVVDINGLVKYNLPAKIELTVPDQASQDDINQMYALLKNIFSHTQLSGNFKDLSASI